MQIRRIATPRVAAGAAARSLRSPVARSTSYRPKSTLAAASVTRTNVPPPPVATAYQPPKYFEDVQEHEQQLRDAREALEKNLPPQYHEKNPAVPFLETTMPDMDALPFVVPEDCWFRTAVGNTPMHKISDSLFAKLEGNNYSGSIKDRMILAIVLCLFRDGKLKDGSTLVLTTSGSAGKALAMIQRTLQAECGVMLNCIITMPQGYIEKPVIQELLHSGIPTYYEGANLEEKGTQLVFFDKVFMDVLETVRELSAEHGWVTLDQHHDHNGVLAHRSTALEIIRQVPDVTDVICATGTGATAAGLRAFLPAEVRVHSRPSLPGAIDGLSDVNRYDNYCDARVLEGYDSGNFERESAVNHQSLLRDEQAIKAGLSSGATLWLAERVARRPNTKVVFISADGRPISAGESPRWTPLP